MKPGEIAESLRRLASSPRARSRPAVLRSLSRLAAEAEGGPSGPVALQGPFHPAKPAEVKEGNSWPSAVVEVEIDDLYVENDDFARLAAQVAGAGDEDVDDFKGPYHVAHLELEFDYTTPEPSVGWTGGTQLDGWSLAALDGVVLENEADRKAVEARLEPYVDRLSADWEADAESAARDVY